MELVCGSKSCESSCKTRGQMNRPSAASIRLVWLCFFLCSSGVAHAAAPLLLLPEGIPLTQYGFAFALSLLGGSANSIQRWAKAAEVGNVYLLLARDFICSVSAGMLTFFAAMHWREQMPSALAVIGIFIGGYSGSRALDFFQQKAESFLGRKIDKKAEE
jgi:hypothetical protein